MDKNRREFLKKTSLGVGGLMLTQMTGYASVNELEAAVQSANQKATNRIPSFNMCGFAAPKIPIVRIGYVGLGSRGSWAVTRMLNIEGIRINALCDNREPAVKFNQETLKKNRQPKAAECFGDDYAWKKLCERDDIDLVYIATPWKWHTPVALYAMEHGKHVAIEVPAARNMEECWALVETSERTKKHCMQLENCCYDFFEMLTVCMSQQGVFGELVHGEGAYIHTLLSGMFQKRNSPQEAPVWRWEENLHLGNVYPTHGLGPICWAMDINRGDKMEYLTSMSSSDFQMGKLAAELEKTGDPYFKQFAEKTYRGNMNTSLIRTQRGATILVQHDVTSPRVYDRKHLLSGTKGMAQKYPEPGKIAFGDDAWIDEQKMKDLEEKYSPELLRHVGKAAQAIGGHGGMDFIMDWRLIDCLRNGLPLDEDVYDAALWSSITPLSIWSVANRSNSIDVPDFTGGSWATNKPVDLSLRGGGSTGVVKL